MGDRFIHVPTQGMMRPTRFKAASARWTDTGFSAAEILCRPAHGSHLQRCRTSPLHYPLVATAPRNTSMLRLACAVHRTDRLSPADRAEAGAE